MELQDKLNIDTKITKKEILLLSIEMEKDKNVLRMDKMIYMIISYIFLILISLLKGSDHTKSIINIAS